MKTKTVKAITLSTMLSVEKFIKVYKIKQKDLISILIDGNQNYVVFYWAKE